MYGSCQCRVLSDSFLRWADHRSTGVLQTVLCLSVIVKQRYGGGRGLLGAVAP